MAVTYRALADLIPDPRNARTHPKRQIDQLRASIEAFGFTNPILADPEGHIIAGHGRLQAARAMGLAELPVLGPLFRSNDYINQRTELVVLLTPPRNSGCSS